MEARHLYWILTGPSFAVWDLLDKPATGGLEALDWKRDYHGWLCCQVYYTDEPNPTLSLFHNTEQMKVEKMAGDC
jgi:hypothetical protein